MHFDSSHNLNFVSSSKMLFFFADEPLESETSQPQPESVSAEDSTSAQLNEDKDKIYPCRGATR
jgi:hypothetical protein